MINPTSLKVWCKSESLMDFSGWILLQWNKGLNFIPNSLTSSYGAVYIFF